jgi:hypothetical protein
MSTPSSIEGEVGLALQSAQGTAATAFHMMKFTRFSWEPDVVQDEEGEAEIGGGLDVSPAERYGHQGATFRGEGRCRPGHFGFLLRMAGLEDQDVRFAFHDGVNDVIRVTDDGGGPVDVDILSGTGATLDADTDYTADEVCAGLKAVLDADTTLGDTYTVTFSTTTRKFTIASDGSVTLSLHWSAATCNMSATLGYDDSADDTGSFSYDGDYEIDGRYMFVAGLNTVIRVTDDGGGPADVDILSGDGAMLTSLSLYHSGMVCAGLEAVLDGDTTLTTDFTVTYDDTTKKFTIASDATSTLSLHWSHANSTMQDILGFDDAADDTGAFTYTGDNPADWALAHKFVPAATSADFPWGTILDRFDSNQTLDTLLIDCRINTIGIQGADADVVRFTMDGRCLSFQDATGSETETAEVSTIATPNTKKGTMFFGSAGFKLASLNEEFRWAENIIPALVQPGPEEIIPGRRAASGDADIYFGAEASAATFRAAYYGSASGTEFSLTIVQRALDAYFQSGQAIAGLAADTEDYYGIRLCAPEARMLTYPLEKSGDDPVMATLAFQVTKEAAQYAVVLVNDYASGYYEAA